MAYQRLEPAHEEQIKNMCNDDKTPEEIQKFFKEEYGINLPRWKISYVKCKKNTGKASAERSRRAEAQRKYIGRVKRFRGAGIVGGDGIDNPDVDIKELIDLLQQIDAGYKALLAHFKGILSNLRGELVKSRAEVREMIKSAGIDMPDNVG